MDWKVTNTRPAGLNRTMGIEGGASKRFVFEKRRVYAFLLLLRRTYETG
jgi:hypothetical protein